MAIERLSDKYILIIDANNLFYRYYFKDSKNCVQNLEKFCKSRIDFYGKIIMVFDSENRTRDKYINSYKSNRNKTSDSKRKLKEFEKIVKNNSGKFMIDFSLLPKTKLFFLKINGFEADDLIFYLTQKLQKEYHITLATTDKDYYQFLSNKVDICKKLSYTEDIYSSYPELSFYNMYTIYNFNQEFAYIDPLTQYPIIKALVGDPSDNIKGLYKVGEKTALKLIAQAPDVKSMYSLISEKYSQEEAKQFLIDYQLIMPLPIKFMSFKDLSYFKKFLKQF